MKTPTFIKWAGGKRRLLGDIEKLLPPHMQNYFEPFLGGGSVFFFLKQKRKFLHASLSDKNPELINTFLVVRDQPGKLLKLLKKHKQKHSKDYYYKIRSFDLGSLSKIQRAARFIYLNKTCFNGLYRVNSAGKFNVPIGLYENPPIFDEKTILNASDLLQGMKIKQQSFEVVIDFAKKRDFVYFDPCYSPKNRTQIFNGYTSDGFFKEQQERLAYVFKQLDKRGCKLMLSNNDTAFVRKLYKGYKLRVVKCGRSINSIAQGRGKVKELIITNY